MLGIIKRNFRYLTKLIPTLILLYKAWLGLTSITVHLFGHHIGKEILKPWKRCRKKQPNYTSIKKMPYCERLNTCKLPTLHYRRIRGDMIETYKIFTGKYQPCVAPTLRKGNVFVARGNDLRLEKSQVNYDLRKFGFTNREVNTWNSLPNWVVSANTTNTFKTRLDKFWHNQDIIYNFRAQLQGTGSRSQFLYEKILARNKKT